MLIQADDLLLFTGDSITDCERDRDGQQPDSSPLGKGYVSIIASRLAPAPRRILNRGISGNRIYDLESRVESDLLALKPGVVSILIGINDTWRRYDSGVVSRIAEFEASYRRILGRVRDELKARIVILEPFLLPVPEDRRAWREDIDQRITATRDVAADFATLYVPLDGIFAAACCRAPASHWAKDGVHPTPAGHALIAEAWLEAVKRA